MGWLFLVLAAIVTYRALNPRSRAQFCWGRTQTSIPMSATGRVTVIITFLGVSAAAFGWLPLLAVFFAVPVLACAGAYDSYRHSRRMRQQRDSAAEVADRKSDAVRQ